MMINTFTTSTIACIGFSLSVMVSEPSKGLYCLRNSGSKIWRNEVNEVLL